MGNSSLQCRFELSSHRLRRRRSPRPRQRRITDDLQKGLGGEVSPEFELSPEAIRVLSQPEVDKVSEGYRSRIPARLDLHGNRRQPILELAEGMTPGHVLGQLLPDLQ